MSKRDIPLRVVEPTKRHDNSSSSRTNILPSSVQSSKAPIILRSQHQPIAPTSSTDSSKQQLAILPQNQPTASSSQPLLIPSQIEPISVFSSQPIAIPPQNQPSDVSSNQEISDASPPAKKARLGRKPLGSHGDFYEHFDRTVIGKKISFECKHCEKSFKGPSNTSAV
jgi:hypothetical protein